MPRLQIDDVFPLPLNEVWALLHAHLDESILSKIHPSVLGGRVIREAGSAEYMGLAFPREKVAERTYRIGGRALTTTWSYRIEPPVLYAYEMTLPNRSTIQFENRYAPTAGGTLVQTTIDISLKRIPSFLARWLVRRSLDRADREDLAYARQQIRS